LREIVLGPVQPVGPLCKRPDDLRIEL